MNTLNMNGLCRFCSAGRGAAVGRADEPLVRTANYFAIPSIGSLVPGWLLICPYDHRPNLATAYADRELTELRMRLADILSRQFAAPVKMFEHGAVLAGSSTGCGVDHAHLHLVPIDIDLLGHQDGQEKHNWSRAPMSSIERVVGASEYLVYSADASAKDPIVDVALPSKPISQFFRRAIARGLRRPEEYDYRTHPQVVNTLRTVDTLRL